MTVLICKIETALIEKPVEAADWFSLLDKVLQGKKGVKGLPEQISNCDEIRFVTDPKSETVLARRGSNRVNQCIGGSGHEQITELLHFSFWNCPASVYRVQRQKPILRLDARWTFRNSLHDK